MAAFITKLSCRQNWMTALRAFKLKFMPTFQTKFGVLFIIRLALRAFHLFFSCP